MMNTPIDLARQAIELAWDTRVECSAEELAYAVITALEANGAKIMGRDWEKWMADAVVNPNAQGYVYQAIFDAAPTWGGLRAVQGRVNW
jgi:hypothetical protein